MDAFLSDLANDGSTVLFPTEVNLFPPDLARVINNTKRSSERPNASTLRNREAEIKTTIESRLAAGSCKLDDRRGDTGLAHIHLGQTASVLAKTAAQQADAFIQTSNEYFKVPKAERCDECDIGAIANDVHGKLEELEHSRKIMSEVVQGGDAFIKSDCQ